MRLSIFPFLLSNPLACTNFNFNQLRAEFNNKTIKKKPTVLPQWVSNQTNSNWLGQQRIRMSDVDQKRTA